MSRLVQVMPADMTEDQHRVAQRLTTGPIGAVRGPFEAWIKVPALAERAAALADFLRFQSALPADVVEVAILQAATFSKSTYVFEAHAPNPIAAGVPAEYIDAARHGRLGKLESSTALQVTADFVDELLYTKTVSDVSWKKAKDQVGEAAIVELTCLVGFYVMVCMTITAFLIT